MNNRLDLIAQMVNEREKVSITELADAFAVTEKTIRLDLGHLEKSGVLFRTHGGAIKRSSVYSGMYHEINSFHDRYLERKQIIAKEALTLIRPGYTICLDDGSTTMEIAKLLGSFPVTVITHDIKIVNELSTKNLVDIIVVGGFISRNRDNLLMTSGDESCKFIRKQNADLAFVATYGLTKDGFAIYTRGESDIKRSYMKISTNSYCVADSSKFNVKAFTRFAKLDELSNIITDSTIKNDILAEYQQYGLNITIAK